MRVCTRVDELGHLKRNKMNIEDTRKIKRSLKDLAICE